MPGLAATAQIASLGAPYAIVEDDGITVIEIWDSVGQHDAWFNEVVKPHLPPEPKFAEVRFSNTKQ